MPETLRDFTPADYLALTTLRNAVDPDYPITEEQMRRGDTTRLPQNQWRRWVYEQGGTLIASAGYSQSDWSYHPQKFSVGVSVHPDHRRRGIGRRLYDTVIEAVAPFQPIAYKAHCRSDREDALHFLATRGFTETMREWESRLPLADCDIERFRETEAKVIGKGIRLTTLAQLRTEDPNADRKLYDLDTEVTQDVPSDDPPTLVPFDLWCEKIMGGKSFRPETFFIAVAPDGQYAGISMLWHPEAEGTDFLETGLTGVRRAYRRQGIALALKLRAIDYAKSVGVREVRTENASTNIGMLAINEALGFVRQPAWVFFEKVL
jgi:GNAT superfamily N-acetyltransferase